MGYCDKVSFRVFPRGAFTARKYAMAAWGYVRIDVPSGRDFSHAFERSPATRASPTTSLRLSALPRTWITVAQRKGHTSTSQPSTVESREREVRMFPTETPSPPWSKHSRREMAHVA